MSKNLHENKKNKKQTLWTQIYCTLVDRFKNWLIICNY